MSTELRITPLPYPGGMNLLLQGGALPGAGVSIQRPVPQLDPDLMERFRRSELTPPQFVELRDSITDWLLDTEVRAILKAALPPNGGGLRLVFVILDPARPFVAQLPLELLWHDSPNSPLLLRNDVQSLVYVLSKPPANVAPETTNWPFKALIFRARPADLEAVPEVGPLADEIRALGAPYGNRMVQIDVISREAAVNVPATWNALRTQVGKNDYNVLVYVGHGELLPSATGGEPMGHLIMESEDGGGHDAINAGLLARLLQDHPVSMVVLAGCVTGADPVGSSRQRGGELGVGQALVNSSEAGVQVAVAMRTELRTTAAITFVRSFFGSLLDSNQDPAGYRSAGDIDRAVRAARRELFLDNEFPPQWPAPIVLRATEREPFIEFLAHPITFHVSQKMDGLLLVRAKFWKWMADYSLAAGVPELLKGRQAALDDVTADIRAEALLQGPLLLPRDLPIGAGQVGTAIFNVAGALTVKRLRARVTASSGDWVKQVAVPASVLALFQLATDPNDPGWFELTSKSAGPAQIPEGELLDVQVEVPADTPSGVYPLRIEILEMTPPGTVWPGDGVVIVPRP
jgi:hypothetical protein